MFLTLAAVVVLLTLEDLKAVSLRYQEPAVDEVQLVNSIAAGMRAGASLRTALAAAAASHASLSLVPGLARSGAPLSQIVPLLHVLPSNGKRLAAALQVLAVTGGQSVEVLTRLGTRAAETEHLVRERRALTAQTRLSAAVVGAMPLLWMVFGGTGRIRTLVAAGGAGPAIAVVGIVMQVGGGLAVWRLARA